MLKRYIDFINESDESKDHYYDNQVDKLNTDMKDYKNKKSKLDLLIKTYDYSDNFNKKITKIIESNTLLIKHWSILKKTKRATDLKDKISKLELEMKELKGAEEVNDDLVSNKKDQISKTLEDIKEVEKESKELDKELKDTIKELQKKIIYLKNKLVN